VRESYRLPGVRDLPAVDAWLQDHPGQPDLPVGGGGGSAELVTGLPTPYALVATLMRSSDCVRILLPLDEVAVGISARPLIQSPPRSTWSSSHGAPR
jgi:hypothetical protein